MKHDLTAGSPEHRAARRAAVKQHHPDRGGNTEDLDAALGAVNERLKRPASQQIPPDTQARRPIPRVTGAEQSVTRMLRTTARRAVQRTRRLLPTWVPGSRRYIQL